LYGHIIHVVTNLFEKEEKRSQGDGKLHSVCYHKNVHMIELTQVKEFSGCYFVDSNISAEAKITSS